MKDVLTRFSVAIGGELLKRFDVYCEKHRYPNRSEAVRGLIRAALIEEAVDEETSDAMGVVTLIYDHHAGRVAERLTDLQHEQINAVVTTTHVHLDARRCLEVILLRGRTKMVRKLADDLIGTKGVETGRLVLASASSILHEGEAEAEGHSHPHPHPHGDHEHGHGHSHSHD
ncbi:MAG: nickel-responsive transcriptional regulator NikR [Paludisphaera borealis]|nr:nickel-responsive transcriptional regulator NikR [Paludisphaera borealis]MDR3620541.1 nickel-responsive transcriptional regulator NikR [Paludisphaera borealis]